jgi:hypothetical protein
MAEEQIHLTAPQLARITALAWLEPEFKDYFERDPVNAIRSRDEFNDFRFKFNRVLHVPPKPEDLRVEVVKQIADGKEGSIVMPYSCSCC